jgi:DMSO/TMAO reductase YedYZ molybdopterin-dependent catalytic subunit
MERKGGLMVVRESPLNAEAPVGKLGAARTPSSLIFIRNHFFVPNISVSEWRLEVRGEVGAPRSFTYGQLSKMKAVTVNATLECAGNGRKGFGGAAAGEVAWGRGAVGNPSWTGVPLRDILQACRLEKASQVVAEGIDSGAVAGSAGPVNFARGLPMDKALQRDTIVALKMNGKKLSPEHGYPARLIVPGWYGMASVKWLGSITATSGEPFFGFFNGVKYVYVTEEKGEEKKRLVSEMRVKSLITSPRENDVLNLGRPVVISGKAWSGSGGVRLVEVDSGEGWRRARIETGQGRYSWVGWSIRWTPRVAGQFVLSARATDGAGNVQPSEPWLNRFQYGYNAIERVSVSVR